MILELHRQGVTVSAIARRVGLDRKTVRGYLERGLEPPFYGPRKPRMTQSRGSSAICASALAAFPELTGADCMRELRDLGYTGGYTASTTSCAISAPASPSASRSASRRRPGARRRSTSRISAPSSRTSPATEHVVWLFSLVLGHSRMLWARFVVHQDLQTLLRCHAAAFEALGGVPEQILYDRMRTVFSREDPEAGHIVYNPTLVEFARHYGYLPRACQPYRAKTKGKVERPFRYVREDFFLARSFRNLDDLNTQFHQWLDQVANARIHATTQACRRRALRRRAPAAPANCRPGRSRRFCGSSGASPATAWSRSTATSTACPTPPAGASSKCIAWP